MKKFIRTGMCALLAVCTVAPMVACADNGAGFSPDYQTEIGELRQRLEEQQQKIDALQQENDAFRQQFTDIELRRNAPYGTFCSLEVAYDLGYLTRDDLMCIAEIQNAWYYGNHDTSLSSEQADPLDEDIAREIRETAAYACRTDSSPIPQADYEDISINAYYGCYDGAYAVMVTDAFSGFDTAIWQINVGGVTFHYYDGRRISVYLDSDDYRSVIPENVTDVPILCQTVTELPAVQSEEPLIDYFEDLEAWQTFLQEHAISAEFPQNYDEEYFTQKSLLACLFPVPSTGGKCVYANVCSLWGTYHVSIVYDCGTASESGNVFVLYEILKSDLPAPPHNLRLKTDLC